MTPSSQPSVQIRPARAFSWADLLELWSYRDVLLVLAVRDNQAAGTSRPCSAYSGWVLQPLLAGLIFALIFGHFHTAFERGVPSICCLSFPP